MGRLLGLYNNVLNKPHEIKSLNTLADGQAPRINCYIEKTKFHFFVSIPSLMGRLLGYFLIYMGYDVEYSSQYPR